MFWLKAYRRTVSDFYFDILRPAVGLYCVRDGISCSIATDVIGQLTWDVKMEMTLDP